MQAKFYLTMQGIFSFWKLLILFFWVHALCAHLFNGRVELLPFPFWALNFSFVDVSLDFLRSFPMCLNAWTQSWMSTVCWTALLPPPPPLKSLSAPIDTVKSWPYINNLVIFLQFVVTLFYLTGMQSCVSLVFSFFLGFTWIVLCSWILIVFYAPLCSQI